MQKRFEDKNKLILEYNIEVEKIDEINIEK